MEKTLDYMERKVSIVVPVYNKEKDIKKCISSILKQTYKNLEIVIVNDGSTDDSLKICRDFEHQDTRIQIINKINEGVEIARVIGIQKSIGNYVTFVDSDDYLPDNAIELLVNALEKNNADVSFGTFERVIGNHGLIKSRVDNDIYNHQIITHKDFIEKHLQSFCGWGVFPVNLCGKLYKKELMQEIVLSNLRYGEDLCLNLQVLPHAKKIVSIPEVVYSYKWGGVTTFLEERVFEDALKQYLFKRKYFELYERTDCLEMSKIELVNFFLTYVDACINNYSKKEQQLQKINLCINNEVLQMCISSVEFDWAKSNEMYCAIKDRNIDYILKERMKKYHLNVMKKKVLSFINAVC